MPATLLKRQNYAIVYGEGISKEAAVDSARDAMNKAIGMGYFPISISEAVFVGMEGLAYPHFFQTVLMAGKGKTPMIDNHGNSI